MRLPTLPRGMRGQIAESRAGAWLTACLIATAILGAVCVGALVAARSDADQRAEAIASSTATIAAYEIARTIERFDLAIQGTIGRLQSPAVLALDDPMR